jgi:hypothetical protein
MLDKTEAKTAPFRLEEATIDDLHAAIRSGATTVVAVVQHYLARVRAYNGVASALVTPDGAPVPQATGVVRAGAPLKFPTQTVKASTILPDLDKYQGPPLEFGRMEATASNPKVPQQFGMIVGIPNAGQLNAIGTLNIRGERSVTCWGEFDKHPSLGPLPPGAPPVCEFFRQQPDALERAAELDKAFGKNPDLDKMPMYGVVFSFKDPFDTKDMRSTGGGDAAYDIDFPARDHVLVEQLRNKGAIIFAKAVNTEYNGRAGDPGGRNKPDKVLPSTLGYQRSTWAGNPSNPYDTTTRSASLGSSSGSGVSVSANMVMASLGRGDPAPPAAGPPTTTPVALILPHKAMLGFDAARSAPTSIAIRSGNSTRAPGRPTAPRSSMRSKDPVRGLLRSARSRHDGAALVRCWARPTPARRTAWNAGALKGVRLCVLRESMVHSEGLQDRGSRSSMPPRKRSRPFSANSRRGAGGIHRSAVDTRPRRRDHGGRLPQGAGAAGAGVHAGPVVSGEGRRHAGVPGFRRRRGADRIRAGKGFRHRQDAADRLLRPRWPRAASRRRKISILPPSRIRRWRTRSVSTSRNISHAAPAIGKPRASPRRWPIGLRSMRGRNSGATTSAPHSRTGRRLPIRAIHTAAGRASTSASCCASCCAAST